MYFEKRGIDKFESSIVEISNCDLRVSNEQRIMISSCINATTEDRATKLKTPVSTVSAVTSTANVDIYVI